ncbi:MAG: cation transporter [Chitinophagaceae bacterium]|nr:cation transporter [Chitinophagaceae bacterium]
MGSKLFIYVALAADIGIAITKFIAASITGSSAMLSEGIHSVIDSVNQLLLLLGIKRSKKKPDAKRPFGYGRELYFWSFIVSLLLFSLGGCISFYEGIRRIKQPTVAEDQTWNYIVLGVSFVFTIITAMVTLKKFNKQRGELGFLEAIKESKDPALFIVLLGDVGDLIGLLIAFLGVYLGHLFHNPYYDGIASMAIGVFLIIISLLLVRESKSLLMGESMNKKTLRKIIALAQADPAIEKVKRHFSIYLAPEEVVLQLIAVFKKDLATEEITEAIKRIIKNIQENFPRIKQIFIEPG